MISMLLQRLIIDGDIGFNYDYMGNALFENGATASGRAALAQAYVDGNLQSKFIDLITVRNRMESAPIKVAVLAHKDHIAEMGDTVKVSTLSEMAQVDREDIVAWMNVGWDGVDPFLLIRASVEDRGSRVESFLRPFVNQIKEAALIRSNTQGD